MPEPNVPPYSLGQTIPRVAFPLRPPPADTVGKASSVISDDHTSISIHPWTGPDPVIRTFSDDPVAFECDYRPFTVHPTHPQRHDQTHIHTPSQGIQSSPKSWLRSSQSPSREKVFSTPGRNVGPLSQVTLAPLRHTTVDTVELLPQVKVEPPPQVRVESPPQARVEPPPHTRSEPLPKPKFEPPPPANVEPQPQARIEPLHQLRAEPLPQVHVEPIVPANVDLLQQVKLGSSGKSSARSSGTYPRLVVETPRTSSLRTSLDAEVSENKGSSRGRSAGTLESDATQDKAKKVGACGSFAYGTVLGLIPVLLAVRVCVHYFRKGEGNIAWDERWTKYGCTFGLFLLVGIAIIVVIVNIS